MYKYSPPFFIPYRNPSIQLNLPAPGVSVRLENTSTSQIIGTGTSDENGNYTITADVSCFTAYRVLLQPQQLPGLPFEDISFIQQVSQCDVPNSPPHHIGFELRWASPLMVPLKGATSDENHGNPSCQMSGRFPSNGVNSGVGLPVNVTNGNMYLSQTDYKLPGIGEAINLARSYNSSSLQSGIFGQGWSTDYDEKITVDNQNPNKIRIGLSDGRGVYFERANAGSPFVSKTEGFFSQLVLNANSTYTLTFKDGGKHQFSAGGKLLWMKDRQGLQTTLVYDGNSNLAAISDSFGRVLNVQMNNGLVTQVYDSIGLVAGYLYNTDGTLQTVNYPDGSKYQFEYVIVLGRPVISKVKDAAGNTLEGHQYDSQGRAYTSEKEGGAEKLTLQYVDFQETRVTDALNHLATYLFNNSKGRGVIEQRTGICSCGNSENESFYYDENLNLIRKLDGLGRETTYSYDANGNRLTATDVMGTQNWTYNSISEVLTYKDRIHSQDPDPNINTITNTYDANGNLLTTKDALNNITTLTYTALGQLATVKDALNQTTTLVYDAFGRLMQVKDANNKTTNYGYDARARLTSLTNALNETTNFEYDLNNRLKKVTHADTTFMSYTYDLAGRRTQMTDERGNTTNYGYDTAYRLTSVTDALTHTTNYGYDLMSNLTSQTDALGNTTNYEYEDFNRLKKVIYPPSTTGAARLEESLTYDTVGNVKTRTDTAGRVTNYDYDTANRLIKVTDALSQMTQFEYNARSQMTKVKDALNQEYVFAYDALGRQLSQTRAGSTMSFEYDAVGNRTKRIDYVGRVSTYEYDALNRLKKINYLSAGNPTPILTASFNYDDLSRLTSAINEAGTVSFTYDNRGRVKTSTDVFNHLVEYNYDSASNRTLLKLDSAVHTTYNYDAANRLTTLTDEASQNFTFGYDVANKLISKTLPNGVSTTYNYDGMSRLTRLKNQTSTAILTDNNFAYNPANQISQIAELGQIKNFTYDNIDRLTAMNNGTTNENYAFDGVNNRTSSHLSASYDYQPFNRMTSTATASMYYDSNGNLVSKAQGKEFWRYVWDYENRMTIASTRKQTVRYRYDALGRRVQRYFAGTKENTKFIYDGLDVVADDNSGVLTKYQNGLGIDNKLKMVTTGTAKYFLADHLGSTVGLTDSSGNLSSSASYDSFGNATGNINTRYQFTGREFDNFTGLHFYRARWYDAILGRFISEDPIGLKGGINQFGYVNGNPVSATDPFGLYAVIFLDLKNGYMRAWDLQDGEKYVDAIRRKPDWEYGSAFSGGGNRDDNSPCKNNSACELKKEEGPIPHGVYALDGSTNVAGEGWRQYSFRLYRQVQGSLLETQAPEALYSHIDAPIGDSGIERGGYYLHPGMISHGCVTIPSADRDKYEILRGMLENTKKMSFFSRYNRFVNMYQQGSGFLYVY